jgi:hypothetical protein
VRWICWEAVSSGIVVSVLSAFQHVMETRVDGTKRSLLVLPKTEAAFHSDELQPEVTSWRILVKMMDESESATALSVPAYLPSVLCTFSEKQSLFHSAAGAASHRKCRIVDDSHQVVVVDIDRLVRGKLVPDSDSSLAVGVSTTVAHPVDASTFPNGLVYVPESALKSACEAGISGEYCGVAIDPVALSALSTQFENPAIFPKRRGNFVTLYHGTSPNRVGDILQTGFLRPACRQLPQCKVRIPFLPLLPNA